MRLIIAAPILATLFSHALAYEIVDESGKQFTSQELDKLFTSMDFERLLDPDSAKLRQLFRTPSGICGYINAKNTYGGYVGYRKFSYVDGGGSIIDRSDNRKLHVINVLCGQ